MYYRVIFIIFIKLKFKNFNSVAFAIVLDKAFLVTLGEWSILRNRCCRDHSQTKATDLIVAKKVFLENGFNLSPAGLREMAAAAIFAQHKSQLKVKTIG
jgi:hypothetical protein